MTSIVVLWFFAIVAGLIGFAVADFNGMTAGVALASLIGASVRRER